MSPSLLYRSDMERWQTGVAELENMFVHVQGAVSNRSGTQYIATSRNTAGPPRLIEFVYNNEQSYVLELGEHYIRIITEGSYITREDGSILEVATPYTQETLLKLRYAQSADVMTLTHPAYPVYNFSRRGLRDWSLEEVIIGTKLTPPKISVTVTNGNAGNTGTSPGVSHTDYSYAVTAISTSGHDESELSNIVTVSAFNLGYCNQYGNYNTISWKALPEVDHYRVYRKYAGSWGLIAATADLTFDDKNYAPDTAQGPPQHNNPFDKNNPVAIAYIQQRRVFAGSDSQPQTLWLSRSSNFTNFDTHTPVVDDDAITATISSQKVSEIQHLVAMADLLLFTGSALWKIGSGNQGGTHKAITPSDFIALPQIYIGCAEVPPLPVNNDVLYVESKGSHVRDLQYDLYSDLYDGNDLSVMADHLFYGYTIRDWDFAQFPYDLLWACRSDGVLLGLTYLKEQQIQAWHTHSTPKGLFRSVAVVPETNDYGATEDIPYFVVERELQGQKRYMIERMVSRQMGPENNDIARGWFVDCGLRYEGEAVSSVSGLEHLEGESVSANINGHPFPSLLVQNGRVTLPMAGSVVTIGLAYTAHMKTLPLALGQPPIFSRRKRVSKIFTTLYQTYGLQISVENTKREPIGPQDVNTDGTGLFFTIPKGSWGQGGQVDFYQDKPLPCTITTLQPEIEVGD